MHTKMRDAAPLASSLLFYGLDVQIDRLLSLVAGCHHERIYPVYTRILVPLDGSAVAEGALDHAVQMADRFGSELILLRAAFLSWLPEAHQAEAQQTLVRESEAYLNEMVRQLQRPGRRIRTAVRWNKAAEAIIDYAVEHQVSVVVIATRGHSSLERWPMGSIAEKVLRSMRVPTLLVRPP